jgi:hypothetical protein
MTKTLKNVIMVFTILCAIFLAFFTIELLLLNREGAEEGTGPASSVAQEENGDNGSGADPEGQDPAENGAASGAGDENGDSGSQTQEDPPAESERTRFELPMIEEGLTLILYADTAIFEHTEQQDADVFTYLGDGTASLYISFDFITRPGGLRGLASRFLLGYLDNGEPTVTGDGQIGDSQIRGMRVIGEKNGETYEAWIHSITGSTEDGLAIVFVLNYENDLQRDELFAILDTMEMVTDTETNDLGL